MLLVRRFFAFKIEVPQELRPTMPLERSFLKIRIDSNVTVEKSQQKRFRVSFAQSMPLEAHSILYQTDFRHTTFYSLLQLHAVSEHTRIP